MTFTPPNPGRWLRFLTSLLRAQLDVLDELAEHDEILKAAAADLRSGLTRLEAHPQHDKSAS